MTILRRDERDCIHQDNIGLPTDFHMAAEEIYQRLSKYEDVDSELSLEKILRSLLS